MAKGPLRITATSGVTGTASSSEQPLMFLKYMARALWKVQAGYWPDPSPARVYAVLLQSDWAGTSQPGTALAVPTEQAIPGYRICSLVLST